MQFKVTSALAFATLVAAARPNTRSSDGSISPPVPGDPLPTIPASACNTGELQCCNSAQLPTAPAVTTILGPLGISASSISGLVGLTCSPISVIGGSASCSAQPVCCTDNSFNGVVALGCNPVNLSL
ncbi:fungal hydrophobin [Phlegmacium glaucopus]|nr:fungal hydrophobin [Phlegmacium glaucopus]